MKEKYNQTFQWILIDEYQDINHSQYQLVRMLLNKECNLFAIGDPNQSIYGFRGSDVEFIRRFRQDYINAIVYQLKKSYRCTDRILKASTSVLSQEEEVLKGTSRGIKLHIDMLPGDRAEAEFIVRTIDELVGGMQFHSMDRGVNSGEESLSLSDFAVLCRTRAQMEIIESVFSEKNIPYQVVSRESSFSMDPVKTVLDILSAAIEKNPLSISLIEKKNITPQTWENLNTKDSVYNALSVIIEKFPELHHERHALSVQRLTAISEVFGNDLSGFLHHIRLGAGVDTWEAKAERVSLMTIHASKGLEFECVFIPGCEDGIIPYSLNHRETDTEEEKRLLYVAMTRASQHLYISHALKRRIFNRELHLPKSPFLNAIEQNLFEASFREKKKEKDDAQLKLF